MRFGKLYRVECTSGGIVGLLGCEECPEGRRGTRIAFQPSVETFGATPFDLPILEELARRLMDEHPDLTVQVQTTPVDSWLA